MYDVLITGGRVMDPETGHDAVADVAIQGGRIVAIGTDLGPAAQVIGAQGMIVAPGFIDLHAHGQSVAADRMQAFDGITTTLELEIGTLPVSAWYDGQAQRGRILNYGTAAAWVFARKQVMTGIDLSGLSPLEATAAGQDDTRWSTDIATADQVEAILSQVRAGIEDGGIGIGIPNAYASGAGVKEMTELCQLAADTGVPTFTHVAYSSNIDPRSSVESYIRLIGYAGATGARMHICHLNSTSGTDIARCAQILQKAQAQGLPITVEAYPYGTGSTVVSASFFADPAYPQRSGQDYSSIHVVTTGHRFGSREELLEAAADNPAELIFADFLNAEGYGPQQHLLDISSTYPGGAIASDAMPWIDETGAPYTGEAWPLPDNVFSHPRSAGTFTRFFRQFVRERELVPMMEAIRKCTLIPAQIVECAAPDMRRKGRLQAGCDADIVVFDPETLGDRATFAEMNRPSEGVSALLVGGAPVILGGAMQVDARPGRPVRGRTGA